MKKYSYIFLIAILSLTFWSACVDRRNMELQMTEIQESQTIDSTESQETKGQNIQTIESFLSIEREQGWDGVAWRRLDAPVPHQYLTDEDNILVNYSRGILQVKDVVSGDIHFELQVTDKDYTTTLRNNSLSLGVGANDTEMLVTWQGEGANGYVEVAPVKKTQEEPLANATVYQAQTVYANEWGVNTFRAVLTDLEPGQKYAYRVMDEGTSKMHTFTAADGGDVYSFIVHGDPQISDESDLNAIVVYEDIIDQAMDGQKPDLILSLGDQSNTADAPELFLCYLSTEFLKEVPLAVIVGNHEDESDVFSRFFYVPNVDGNSMGSSGDMSGDYWFYRNHTLFMCLNSNNKDLESHQHFLNKAKEECLSRYGQPDWIIAAFHHSLFSAGRHAASESILERREAYVPMFEEVGVDVVFSGHDHTYTRSFPMDELKPLNDGDDGIVYFCLGSPTGTKYYDLYEEEMDYAAVADGSHQPSVTRVDVTKSTMTITTFIRKTDGSLNVLDSYRITK